MAHAQCTCGFAEGEAGDFTITDHLLAMFAPDDDRGTDGRYHLEGEPSLTCYCGLAAAATAELDAHFLAVFTPEDAIGRDSKKHTQVTGTRNSE
jgi:hypothetical protein